MKVVITGKNIELTPGLKEAVETRLSKLDRFFNQSTEANVTLSVDKGGQKAEVTIPLKGRIIRGEEISDDMYVSIELVQESIERQITRYRKKIIDKQQADGTAFFNQAAIEEADTAEDEIKIVRTKRFGVKPMFPEDACMEMEMLGHDFYMFLNADTDQVCVVYKRKGGSYGLIEPDFE